MNLRRLHVSDTVTRYRISAHLGPHSQLLLVRPDDSLIITGWSSGTAPRQIDGEWVSPYPDLEAVVQGIELDVEGPVPASLAS
jgi:hypothetical protein